MPMGPSPVIVTKLQLRLGHGGQIEAAYRRSDLFERRRVLMNDWARYLAQGASLDAARSRRS